jgi:hypothetical protein
MINRLLSILPLACALLAQAVQAQAPSQPPAQSKPQSQPPAKAEQQSQGGFLYKSTMPDGKVIYGDAPEKGAVKVDKTRPDTSKKGISTATPKEMAAAKRQDSERAASGSNTEQTRMLEETLHKLEAAREKEKEPREGERIGTAGGGSRFTEAYLERQKKLDEAIAVVRKELDRARATK